MGFDKSILLTLAILFASAAVFANESKLGLGNLGSSLPNANLPQVPFIGNFSRPSLTGSFLNRFPGLANIFLPFRQKRSIAQIDEQQDAPSFKQTKIASAQSGAPGDKLAVVTGTMSCNYAAQPGRRCRSCRESITCYPNNRAVVSRCYLLFRYCNNGRCSINPGARCRRTTTSTSIETETTSTSTSSTTASTSSTSTANTTSTSTTPTSSTSSSSSSATSTPSTSSRTSSTSPTLSTSTSSSSSSTSTASSTTVGGK